jgi:hypothetical protein
MATRVLACVLSVCTLFSAMAAEVFVVSDIYTVAPDGGTTELASGKFDALADRNVHWDGAAKTIKMYGARNEEVAVQIVIARPGKGYGAKVSDLAGPGTIPAARISTSAMCWVPVCEGKGTGFVHDLVIPLDGSVVGIKDFDIPLAIKGVPAPGNQVGVMLYEVWIPKDAKAGKYKGKVQVMAAETEVAALNVELEVFNFELPDQPAFAFDLLEYGMPSEGKNGFATSARITNAGLGKGANKVSDLSKKLNHHAYKVAADHRCFVNVLPYSSQRGTPTQAYPVDGKGASAKIMSYTEFDELFAPILDGKCNKFGQPPMHFTLAFNANYPHICESEPKKQFNWMPFKTTVPDSPGKDAKLKEFEETNKAIAEQYVTHFAEKGWTKTRFEIYHNQKTDETREKKGSKEDADRNTLPWKLDEPTEPHDYQALRYLLNTGKWAFASAKEKGIQIATRIDIGHFHCHTLSTPDGKTSVCYKAKSYDKANAKQTLKDAVDHWFVGMTHSEGGHHHLKDYEREGAKMMRYGSDGAGVKVHYAEFAGEGFESAHLGFVGRLVYKLDPLDPNSANLRNSAMYHGKSLGFEGFLAPHRMKLWRNAVNDYDYILEARKKDKEAANAIVGKMVRLGLSSDEKYRAAGLRAYYPTNNVEDFARAKVKLAALITGQKAPEGFELQGNSDVFSPCGSKDTITGYD